MQIEYYQLPGLEEISLADLTLTRSHKLLSAIKRNKEYELLKVMRRMQQGDATHEYFIVDVTCDEVPSRKSNGLLYKERIALEVSKDETQLVNVLALRKDFPILIHQHQTRLGTPAQLCLYFDTPSNVHRNWTAENFLKRIIWWIEKSSRGELHPADQPVEGLFFASPIELVLPWNFDELNEKGVKFKFLAAPSRQDKGFTLFALDASSTHQFNNNTKVTVIQIKLTPIVQNQVEQSPYTLGDLTDLLATKNINLIQLLKESLELPQGTVGDLKIDSEMVLILLDIPIKRAIDKEPEGKTHQAFIVPIGAMHLGIDIGILDVFENKVVNNVLAKPDVSSEAKWRGQKVDALSVLYFSSPELARLRSGILNSSGPNGVLIGVGALGSTMIDLWVRSGWGNWSIIDLDYLKPHNLVRHTGFYYEVGSSKVDLVADHCFNINLGATKVEPLNADANNFDSQDLQRLHHAADLVIDASTTLQYPRKASSIDDLARHISVFITPNGNSSVLFAENKDRTIRLRTLEAQYYRNLINGMLGKHVINESDGTFISGSSCRDISTIMPYSKIVNHSSTLAEQIIEVAKLDSSAIRVWNRNESDGSISYYEITPQSELSLPIDEFTVYVDQGLLNKVRDIRAKALPNETGGILLGYFDFNVKAIVIVDVMTAPVDSVSSRTTFERGIEGTLELIQNISHLTGDMVSYIGEWHSHPPGCSSRPSTDDYSQLVFLSLGMAQDGLPAISLIVGENDIRVLKSQAN